MRALWLLLKGILFLALVQIFNYTKMENGKK